MRQPYSFAGVAVLAIAFAAPDLAAQGVCATCSAIPSLGGPVNDACTQVIVAFQRNDSGDCTLNPNPKCVAHVNCLFSFTVQVNDKGCGSTYSARYCTQLVNTNGTPVGVEQCGAPGIVPNPTVVIDYPVSCGKVESIKYERVQAGVTTVIAQPSGTCTACPAQVVGGGG